MNTLIKTHRKYLDFKIPCKNLCTTYGCLRMLGDIEGCIVGEHEGILDGREDGIFDGVLEGS